MKRLALLPWIVLLLPLAAAAQPVWTDRSGLPVPETESRRNKDGLGGWLVATPDADWREKWMTPSVLGPTFNAAKAVPRGTPVHIMIFVANVPLNAEGHADLSCDIEVQRPDGRVAMRQERMTCMRGPIAGNPRNMYLSGPVLTFTGEPSDLLGAWTVHASLKDNVRGTSMALKTSFILQ
jgi:hypothetical protein